MIEATKVPHGQPGQKVGHLDSWVMSTPGPNSSYYYVCPRALISRQLPLAVLLSTAWEPCGERGGHWEADDGITIVYAHSLHIY